MQLLTVNNVIKTANLLLVYKIKNQMAPEYLQSQITVRSQFVNYNIRLNDNFNIGRVRIELLEELVMVLGFSIPCLMR